MHCDLRSTTFYYYYFSTLKCVCVCVFYFTMYNMSSIRIFNKHTCMVSLMTWCKLILSMYPMHQVLIMAFRDYPIMTNSRIVIDDTTPFFKTDPKSTLLFFPIEYKINKQFRRLLARIVLWLNYLFAAWPFIDWRVGWLVSKRVQLCRYLYTEFPKLGCRYFVNIK